MQLIDDQRMAVSSSAVMLGKVRMIGRKVIMVVRNRCGVGPRPYEECRHYSHQRYAGQSPSCYRQPEEAAEPACQRIAEQPASMRGREMGSEQGRAILVVR